ncbi:MAG: hypothetical protein ACTSUE_04110, partial [Promethearchaeota archaeon]
MTFTAYHTYYKDVVFPNPVTIGYDLSKKKAKQLEVYEGKQFVHSGNWWNIAPEKRTKEIVLKKQLELVGEYTTGLMSMNVQPGRNPYYWIEDEDNESHMETCLSNAAWARETIEKEGGRVPLYCTLQPSTAEMAKRWFQKAIDDGFNNLCIGVSEFLRSPKYRKEGIRRLLEIIISIVSLSKARLNLHLSGLMSYNLLPVVASLGVTSTDGSTPVQPALAYGTVFTPAGTGVQSRKLKDKLEKIDWNCTCSVCTGKGDDELVEIFNDRRNRVIHNIFTWETLVSTINDEILPSGASRWFQKHRDGLPKTMVKYWDLAGEVGTG